MAQNSNVELKWRDTTLRELQSMFSGSVDPEVVQLVLSESNYNVNDTIEKLFVLSGTEQNQKEDNDSDLDDSDLSRQKRPTYHDGRTTNSNKPGHVTNSRTGTSLIPKQSSFDKLPSYGSSSVKTTGHEMTSPLSLSNTTGTQGQSHVPRTVPSSFMLPLSNQQRKDSELCIDGTSATIPSSGLPDFPDSISQQYKALTSQAKAPANFVTFPPKEPSKHQDFSYNTKGRPHFNQQIPGSFDFSKTPHQQGGDNEPKGNVESFFKQMVSQSAGSEEWRKVSHNNAKQQRLDWELSKKKMHSVNAGSVAAHTSINKEQMPYKERTSNSNTPFTNSQNFTFSNPSTQNMLPSHGANKPRFQQTVNNAQQLPNHGVFNSLSKESMFRPPVIQRQFQPFVPPPQFGQVIQGNASQARFGFRPVVQSPWQQGPQRPLQRAQIPHQFPQGTLPYQPPFFLGRAHPSAAVRPTRQASAAGIPFIPTIHQKLLILIRGLPGSGKSSLAQKLKGARGVVLSTDDFFYRNQQYAFDATLLGEAHEWNQKRAKSALEKLLSPVIIDNTNTQCWEMKPYVSMALKHGYYIKFIEPDNTWKWNVTELARRNQHGVGIAAITRMKERYEQSICVEKIMNCERKIESNKTGNDSETRKETEAVNQIPSPRPQRSPYERDSQDLGKRENESCDHTTTGEKTAASETINPRGVERKNNLEAKENEVFDKQSDDCAKCEGMERKCTSEINTFASGDQVDDDRKEESHASSSPKPQRVPRVRDKRSPNNQQNNDTELTTHICDEGLSVKQTENLISCDNRNELELNKATPESDPEEDSALRVEDLELCKVASAANSSVFSPPFFKAINGEVIQEGAKAPESSKSSFPCESTAPFSVSPPASCGALVLNASFTESDESDETTNERVCEAKPSELTEKASNEGQILSELESPDKTPTLSLARPVDDDVTDCGNVVLKQHQPIPTPPPLSTILASASRSKQKRYSSSNRDHRQPIANEGNSTVENALKRLVGPSRSNGRRELSEITDNITQENENSVKDVSSDVQNLSDELQQATSGDSRNDMPAGVEFLKTCFPDVDSDLVNALLTANSGDVMKVVDELLADVSDLPSFPTDGSDVIKHQSPAGELPTFPDSRLPTFNPLTVKLKSLKPADESLVISDSAPRVKQQSSVTREDAEIPGEMSTRLDRENRPRALGSRPLAQAQSPSHNTFQLTLEPAVALHLVEMFGPFPGINFQDDISHEDLVIDADNSLARQLYKKWERSIQTRKGIPVAKKGNSPRANRELTDPGSRNSSGTQASPDNKRPGNLREIMDEQLALELSRNANVADVNEQDIATKLKRQTFYEMFPGVDPVALEEVFQANRYELAPSVEAVKASCNLSSHSSVTASEFRNQEETTRKEPEEDWSWLYVDDSSRSETNEASFQTLEAPNYRDYRAESFQHYKQRDQCFKKAALAFSNKQGQLAQFYARQGHMHTEKIKEANARAAALILDQTNESTDENTIDLHGLHVTEAIEALESMLIERTDPNGSQFGKGCKEMSVITGRGNNSRGGRARLKPAILEYLKKNNYIYTEPHPGLVKVFL